MGQEAAIQSAWDALKQRPCEEVCRQAAVRFDEATGSYVVKCFGHDVVVTPATRGLATESPAIANLVGRFRYFFELSAVWYLAGAKEAPLSDKLIRPTDLKSGPAFAVGSHQLPMERLAALYGEQIDRFEGKGQALCSRKVEIGDSAMILYPFPRIPITLVLWKADEEFKARADLLLDASCERHLPQDLIWATALFTCLMIM